MLLLIQFKFPTLATTSFFKSNTKPTFQIFKLTDRSISECMGSKAAEVWRYVVPVIPCSAASKYKNCVSSSRRATKKSVADIEGEIAAVGARVSYIEEQMENIKAALPQLDSKIGYASLGMPVSSFSLEEMQILKRIHFQLLQFWEDLSRKQLEKLEFLSHCLEVLEEQRAGGKQGQEEARGFGHNVTEKLQSDLRRNQELEMKMYLDRVRIVSDFSSKPAPHITQIPPERGPRREQMRTERKNSSEESMLPLRMTTKVSSSEHQSPIDRHQRRCKIEDASASSTPVLHPIQMPSRIKV